MRQRLVRAKAKIRDARIAFDVPEPQELPDRLDAVPQELPDRLDAVLDAIYAAYGTGWEDAAGADPRRRGLAKEAIWLARIAVHLLPEAAEARGLLALMLYCEARRPARRTEAGAYVPLSDQDVGLWCQPMMEEAKGSLAKAAALHRLGRYQLEAAIQSLHAMRLATDQVNWPSIVRLYDSLVDLSPTIGALTGRAAAVAEYHWRAYRTSRGCRRRAAVRRDWRPSTQSSPVAPDPTSPSGRSAVSFWPNWVILPTPTPPIHEPLA